VRATAQLMEGKRKNGVAKYRVGPSTIDGTGLFAAHSLPARRKIGELAGERISRAAARRRARTRERVAIVELYDGTAIDAAQGNEFSFINHACRPNLYMRIFNAHVEFYTLRRIAAGEELTCDYGLTHHDGKLRCGCRSDNCRGFI
jgi:SET domain-containing protein